MRPSSLPTADRFARPRISRTRKSERGTRSRTNAERGTRSAEGGQQRGTRNSERRRGNRTNAERGTRNAEGGQHRGTGNWELGTTRSAEVRRVFRLPNFRARSRLRVPTSEFRLRNRVPIW